MSTSSSSTLAQHASTGSTGKASVQAPPGQRFQDWLASWDASQIEQWLAENKCSNHAALFAAHDITGAVLLDVDHQALKEMGIHSVGERVKIAVAVKKLRQACVASQRMPEKPPSSGNKTQKHPPPPLQLHQSHNYHWNRQPAANNGALTSSSNHASSSSTSSHGSASLVPPGQPPYSMGNISPSGRKSPMSRSAGSSGSGSTIASSSGLPAPKSSLPPPPVRPLQTQERLRTPTGSLDLRHAPSNSQSSRSKAGTWNSHVPTIGLPPNSGPGERSSPHVHRKTPSASPGLPSNPRPSGAASSSYGHHQPLSSHPFATSSSPTMDQFPPSSAGSSRSATAAAHASRPSTSSGAPGTGGLSPITESHSQAPSPIQAEYPRSIQSTLPASVFHSQQQQQYGSQKEKDGFTVGRGAFGGRSGTGSSLGSTGGMPPATLEELLKRAVKFVGEGGEYKMVNVEGCRDATDILGRALRKFGKLTTGDRSDVGEFAEMDGWVVYATNSAGASKALTDYELFDICQSTNRPERSRGLLLRRLPHHLGGKRRNKALREFFGEELPPSDTRNTSGLISPTSPTTEFNRKHSNITVEPASPEINASPPTNQAVLLRDHSSDSATAPSAAQKSVNRASALSVLSGLEGEPPPSAPANRSSRLRSFFGHRPPSELISNHLADYFPSAEKKLLNKTRSSVRRSIAAKHHPLAWETDGPPLAPFRTSSRFSVSSQGSSGTGLSIELPPPLPAQSSIQASRRRSSYAPKPLNDSLGGVSPTDDDPSSDVASLKNMQPNSRMSHLSAKSKASAQDSDLASLLTIDEITDKVEQRRQSVWSVQGTKSSRSSSRFDDSSDAATSEEDDDYEDTGRRPSVALPHEEEEEDSEEESEVEDESEEESEEEQEGGPEKVTSKGSKNQIKWIKGALIGSGSFGQVFLAMNAMNGTLMAVKQVEIPTDDSSNEARKRSMVDALEREIDFLKGLQHPNIVEYLDSSSDAQHLNIFLEYVPGGSVAALLRNYGAFEEPLVKTFCKQILQGLNYLHERDIVHRDIKGANILVDNKGSIKISDFGISKRAEDSFLSKSKVHRPSLQGSVFWMAPEVVKQTSYTSKADIWSLGCVTIEMLTGDHPYINLNQMQALFKIGTAKGGPEIPDDISADAQKFLELTFMLDYNARPSASEMLQSAFIGGVSGDIASQQTPTAASFSL